jgi:predicted MFS family arabinose efflux permease
MQARSRMPQRRLALIFALFAAGYFLSYSFRSIGPLIAPDLMRELTLDAGQLGLLASVYFLTFALAQPAIGIAMDRHGPARVNAVLFATAAAGAIVFATSEGLAMLAFGRALIGLGVSGALMTALKAFVVWFPPAQREALSGAMMAVGGIAAMLVSIPAELAMRAIGWRGMFLVLGATSVVVAAALWWWLAEADAIESRTRSQPASAGPGTDPTSGGFRTVFASRIFMAYAPLAFFGSGGFTAVQSLWAGPWLIEVAGHSRARAAEALFAYGLALFAGYLLVAFISARIRDVPGAPRRLYVASLAIAYAALAAIISNRWPDSHVPWFAYGLTLGAGMLAYPALTRVFPAAIAGRVVTAYNVVMFAGGFVLQWAIGALIQALLDGGMAKPLAYQVSFAALLATQVMALAWFWVFSRTAPATT